MAAGDATRLVAITDLALCDGDALDARIAAMAAAVPTGALAVQLRARTLGGRALWQRAARLRAVTAAAGATLWINDRLDVALAVGADGVHLPEDGLPAATARALAPGLAIGASRHDPGTALDVDRIQLGPIWPTPSKAGLGAPLGAPALTALRARWAGAVTAVGGIDGADRAHAAAAAGADAVAAIRALWLATDPGATARALVDAVIAGVRSRTE
ncbi:MAG: thiamine phosphate synthase [Myxococcales bacterium]|nr:thiamine phosphate synthase [Myxococcales bacterium]